MNLFSKLCENEPVFLNEWAEQRLSPPNRIGAVISHLCDWRAYGRRPAAPRGQGRSGELGTSCGGWGGQRTKERSVANIMSDNAGTFRRNFDLTASRSKVHGVVKNNLRKSYFVRSTQEKANLFGLTSDLFIEKHLKGQTKHILLFGIVFLFFSFLFSFKICTWPSFHNISWLEKGVITALFLLLLSQHGL